MRLGTLPSSFYYFDPKLHKQIIDHYKYKSPQQNISELNPTIYEKGYVPRPNGMYHRNAKVV